MSSAHASRDASGNVGSTGHCCAPSRPQAASQAPLPQSVVPMQGSHSIVQATIPAGVFRMGDAAGVGNQGDGETPVHEVALPEFTIDATSVTNDAFAVFIEETDYRTDAERFDFSAVFYLAAKTDRENLLGAAPDAPWWLGVRGADWSHPGGPGTNLDGLGKHPAVHISWNDAIAYCGWAGRRLPTEAEWECASRGGLSGAIYPWGDELMDANGAWQCNIWQGEFPRENSGEDGWLTTAPVETFRPNGFGLWQTVGNVWEWCSDWFSPSYYESSPVQNPQGPSSGTERAMRGGSFLCHDSYCNRYRPSARTFNTPDSSMSNTGFRTVALSN